MIEYINGKLNQWGLWCRTGRSKLGYPTRAAFVRLVPAAGSGGSVVICDDEAMQINRAVQSLPRDLHRLVELFYIKMRSCGGEQIAKSLGMSRDTLYVRLHRAHVLVMDAIHEDELTGSDSFCKKQASCGLVQPLNQPATAR